MLWGLLIASWRPKRGVTKAPSKCTTPHSPFTLHLIDSLVYHTSPLWDISQTPSQILKIPIFVPPPTWLDLSSDTEEFVNGIGVLGSPKFVTLYCKFLSFLIRSKLNTNGRIIENRSTSTYLIIKPNLGSTLIN